MPRKSDLAEGFWSITLACLVVAVVAMLVMAAPSIEEVLRNY